MSEWHCDDHAATVTEHGVTRCCTCDAIIPTEEKTCPDPE